MSIVPSSMLLEGQRSHECERGTHECVRHTFAAVNLKTEVIKCEMLGSAERRPL
jgi:hypothetical protein